MSKKLLAALIAFSMVGAFGCDEDSCTHSAKQCDGTVPQVCMNGDWVNGADCGAVGCNVATGMCNTNGGNNNPGGDNNNPGGDNNNPGGDNN
ncbi:MAG: hypothetical protein J6S69_12075, partial [Proteobacteria bacterium]|nr:hypothetical protein [Pseudomonadota bacterium]